MIKDFLLELLNPDEIFQFFILLFTEPNNLCVEDWVKMIIRATILGGILSFFFGRKFLQ